MRFTNYNPAPAREVISRAALILIVVLLVAVIPVYFWSPPQPPRRYVVQCSPGAGLAGHYETVHDDLEEAKEDARSHARTREWAACSMIPTTGDDSIPKPGG